MSDNEEGSGISAGGLATGVIAGAGAAALADNELSKHLVKQAWQGKDAPKTVKDKILALFGRKDAEAVALKDQASALNKIEAIADPNLKIGPTEEALRPLNENVAATKKAAEETAQRLQAAEQSAKKTASAANKKTSKAGKPNAGPTTKKPADPVKAANTAHNKALKAAEDAEKALETQKAVTKTPVTEAKFVTDSTKNTTHYRFKADGVHETIKIDGLPTGQTANVVHNGEEAIGKSFAEVKSQTGRLSKELTTDISKATKMNELGAGFKHAHTKGQLIAGGAVLATVGIGTYIGSKMFPSHVRDVEQRRAAERDMAR